MKTLIRNIKGLYFRADGSWTEDWKAGKNFETGALAIWETRVSNLKSVEIVLVMDGGPSAEHNVILHVHDPPLI
jgi:hypothetical protein